MEKFKEACIIDDDMLFVVGTRRLMEIVGFTDTIINFENGQEALNYLVPRIEQGLHLPDVIFLDINMPVVDGWMFLDQLMLIPNERVLKIYIVTSSIADEDMERAKQYNTVSNYIVKPVTRLNLMQILKEAA